MASAGEFDVSRFIDERRLNRFNASLVIWSFFIVLFDGYDITAISFAAPELIKTWGITNRAELGPIFSSSLFGILIGSPLFGYIGDRYGRKIAVIGSCLIFGAFTLLACWAGSLRELFYLRFVAGIGLGGLLPNLIALNAEYAPRRLRATLIIVMFTGITFGGAVPGAISVWLVPQYGWQAIFAVGGVLPILMAVGAALQLPESLKHVVVRDDRAQADRLLALLKPDRAPDAATRLVVADEKVYRGFNPKYLFADGLALITPLLWICFACNLMGFYFLLSWLPTLLTGAKLPPSEAAIATALVQIGGTVGGLALARPIDAKGFLPVTILFACSVLAVGALGYVGLASGADGDRVPRRVLRAGAAVRFERGLGDDLSDLGALERVRLGLRGGKGRIGAWPDCRRRADRNEDAAAGAVPVGDGPVHRRRGRLRRADAALRGEIWNVRAAHRALTGA